MFLIRQITCALLECVIASRHWDPRISKNMWILKGISLGLGLFFVGSIVYIVNALRPIEANKATGISVLLALTVWNPWYWVAFVSTLTLSCCHLPFSSISLASVAHSASLPNAAAASGRPSSLKESRYLFIDGMCGSTAATSFLK